MHAGAIITRYKTVDDGMTSYERVKHKRPSNNMLLLRERVVWMMPKNIHRKNKLESIYHFGVFAGIVPKTG